MLMVCKQQAVQNFRECECGCNIFNPTNQTKSSEFWITWWPYH